MTDDDDIDVAIRRWWLHDRPAVEQELFKSYRLAHLSKQAMRMMLRGMRFAFVAGWHARGRRDEASGTQQALFGKPED